MGGFISKNHFPVDGRVRKTQMVLCALDLQFLTFELDNSDYGRLSRHGTERSEDSGFERR